jgi:hypothetical protein
MEGKNFAILSSIFLWSLTYLIGFLIISNKFSKGALFNKIASKFKIFRTILITTILFPFLAGIFYGIGGLMEEGKSLPWGCYIEDFVTGAGFLWFVTGFILFLVMILGLINPNKLKLQKRLDLILIYLTVQSFALLMIFVYFIFIGYFSGALSGKDSSCW